MKNSNRKFLFNRIIASVSISAIFLTPLGGLSTLARAEASTKAGNLQVIASNNSTALLDKYTFRLNQPTREADSGIDKYEAEIKQILTLLNNKQANNPIIVADDEMISQQLVESLAIRFAASKQDAAKTKEILYLDALAIAQDADSEAELLARWQQLLGEIKRDDNSKILFIKDLTGLVGAAAGTPQTVRRLLEKAIADGSLRVISTAPSEKFFTQNITSQAILEKAFTLVKPEINEDLAVVKLQTERERAGFVGEKVSEDLNRIIAQDGDKRIKVIAQVNQINSDRLERLLASADAQIIDRIENFNSIEIEIPARNLSLLSKSSLTNYLSPNRSLESFGHLSKTAGLDAFKTQTGNSNLTGSGIGIAILDSGIAQEHSSFTGTRGATGTRVKAQVDFTGSTNQSSDPFGHGTFVGSVAAGETMSDGDARFIGVAQGANVMSVRVLDANGRGSISWVLKGLEWVLSNRTAYNIRVVNLSLGAPAIDSYKNDALCRAVRKLVNHGIIVVAAAGNDGKDQNGNKIYGRIHSPGNEPSAITVGATNSFGTDQRTDDIVTSFSSRGPTRSFWTDSSNVKHYDNLIKPDVVAPGNKIIGAQGTSASLPNLYPTLRAKTSLDKKQNGMYLSGSSVAAPIVAGTIAVMLQANPNLTPNMVKAALQYTAQPLKNANTFEQGAGQLNIIGAAQLAKIMRKDMQAKFASDINWESSTNGYGPVEADRSNGNSDINDGNTIRLNGVTYAKGFGVHPGFNTAQSVIDIPLLGNYEHFMSDIGVDDEVTGDNGSVVFQVWADGAKLYDSGMMRGDSTTKSVRVNIAGKTNLRLVVTDAGDGSDCDHADWAAARLTPKINANDNLLTAELPVEHSNIGVGADFGWSRGIIFNNTYGTGTALITKSNKVFGEGWLLNDGISTSGTTTIFNTTLMASTGLTLATQIKTNTTGGAINTGTDFVATSTMLSDSTAINDGTIMGDGIVSGDSTPIGDGTIMGDSLRGLSISTDGDDTACMSAQ